MNVVCKNGRIVRRNASEQANVRSCAFVRHSLACPSSTKNRPGCPLLAIGHNGPSNAAAAGSSVSLGGVRHLVRASDPIRRRCPR